MVRNTRELLAATRSNSCASRPSRRQRGDRPRFRETVESPGGYVLGIYNVPVVVFYTFPVVERDKNRANYFRVESGDWPVNSWHDSCKPLSPFYGQSVHNSHPFPDRYRANPLIYMTFACLPIHLMIYVLPHPVRGVGRNGGIKVYIFFFFLIHTPHPTPHPGVTDR